MKILNQLLDKFTVFFSWLNTGTVIKAVSVEDFPVNYKMNIIYLVGEDDPWYAVMLCPCGCNEIIRLCLQIGRAHV